MDVQQTGTDQGAVATQEQPTEAPLSIAEHAAQYGPKATPADEGSAEPDPLKPIRPVDQQKREQGKFTEGKKPMRGKDAVTRINTLTERAKTAEERFAAAESRLATAEAELAQMRRQHASPQQIAQAERKVEKAEAAAQPAARMAAPADDPEPQENDAKYGGDYGKFLQDHARWATRDEWRQIQATQAQQREQAQKQHAAATAIKTFGGRIDAAKGKYADFQQIALAKPAPWDEGSAIDAFIMEDDNGADVLYHLQHPTNTQERDEILRLSPFHQLKRLTLLSQRFSSPPSAQAGATTSATGRPTAIVLPPKPPNVVRTEAQRAGDSPPPTDGSLSIAEHAKAFGQRRR